MPQKATPQPSLPEFHSSVDPSRALGFFRRLFAFSGPAYLVSVGYMDPGNWATDLEGGARFGYQLLWVLLLSNAMAVLLQTLSARLGIVTGRDLAQACRDTYPRPVTVVLWILCEVAIAACDLAEVLGAAIALKLLFGLPVLTGVLLTAADTLLLLWLTRYGVRIVEALVLVLVFTIGLCFGIEVWMASPHWGALAAGLVPKLTDESLYVAIGILGATVMPHNLYLHSALVQTRRIGASVLEKKEACKFNLIDSAIALNAALFVNGGILIMAAAVFFERGAKVTQIEQAHLMLAPLLGTSVASTLFAFALLLSGQSSTLTGTLAGQIVMEGFVSIRLRPWLRRLITRLVAIIPAVVAIVLTGESATYPLLILSQVVLSLQLPFAVLPLIQFTSDRARMGEFTNKLWVRILAWAAAAIIVALNLRLATQQFGEWAAEATGWRQTLLYGFGFPFAIGFLLLLMWIALHPVLPAWAKGGAKPTTLVKTARDGFATMTYSSILVPLDHSDQDQAALAHAVSMARLHQAKLTLLHIEEGATSFVYGSQASTSEVEEGEQYLTEIASRLRDSGLAVHIEVRHASDPAQAIIGYARELTPDLIVMAGHGHKGLKDIAFGTTISAVRHALPTPVLIVQA
ncbi:MAG: Nramp family divalent metal transporter [Bryobacteraceae bacterium]|nr:Nramp family divalent metal transporter [Bryobacteraceae bacterium]